MNNFLEKCRNHDLSLLLLRAALGAIFIAHGWQKLTAFDGVVNFFDQLGLPAFTAYLVAGVEFFGGILVVLGLFTEWAALLIAIVMVVAIYLVKFSKGFFGYEFELALLVAALALFFAGPGKYKVSALFKKKQVDQGQVS